MIAGFRWASSGLQYASLLLVENGYFRFIMFQNWTSEVPVPEKGEHQFSVLDGISQFSLRRNVVILTGSLSLRLNIIHPAFISSGYKL